MANETIEESNITSLMSAAEARTLQEEALPAAISEVMETINTLITDAINNNYSFIKLNYVNYFKLKSEDYVSGVIKALIAAGYTVNHVRNYNENYFIITWEESESEEQEEENTEAGSSSDTAADASDDVIDTTAADASPDEVIDK